MEMVHHRWLKTLVCISLAILMTVTSEVKCQQNPTISFITKERVTNIGDTLDISCSVQYAKNYPVIWAKIDPHNPQNVLFISKGASLSIPDNRYSIRHDDASSTYTLQISKIQEIDAGNYQCQVVISSASRVTANVAVYVRIPPVISDNSTRSMITSTGLSIQLECYASGYPQPTVSWRRENNNILPTGGSIYKGNILIIHNITKADRGTYYCIADNNVEPGARRNVMVDVEFAPNIISDRKEYEQAMQYDVDVHCNVESYPASVVRWYKDGLEIQDSPSYKLSMHTSARDFTDSTLHIRRIQPHAYGEYVCWAQNKVGVTKRIFVLRKSATPVCPPACEARWGAFSAASASCASQLVCIFLALFVRFIRL